MESSVSFFIRVSVCYRVSIIAQSSHKTINPVSIGPTTLYRKGIKSFLVDQSFDDLRSGEGSSKVNTTNGCHGLLKTIARIGHFPRINMAQCPPIGFPLFVRKDVGIVQARRE